MVFNRLCHGNDLSQCFNRGELLKKIIILFFVLLFSLSCQIGFYLGDDWGDESINGYTELDKALIFRHESLRKAYKSGDLKEDDGLYTHSNLKYVLQAEDDDMYITFFGTDTVEDFYYDIIHWKEPFWTDVDPEIAVHAGFNRPFQDVAPHIRSEVELFLSSVSGEPHIYISGHSAGGVQAVLCAFYLSHEFTASQLANIHCQTGGSPAAGNDVFARVIGEEKRITLNRYINGSDMMPGMLTEEMGFYHGGQPYHIGPEPDPFTTFTSMWLTWHFIGDYADSLR